MTTPILAFMGESKHGKDASSDWLHKEKGFVKVAFADVMKRLVMKVFGFNKSILWGPSHLRNTPQEIQWFSVRFALNNEVDSWIRELPLSIEEAVEFKEYIYAWMSDLRERSGDTYIGTLTARTILQLQGTEYGRHFKETIWSDYLLWNTIPRILSGWGYTQPGGIYVGPEPLDHQGIVISDCRFRSELHAIEKNGGHVIKVRRKSLAGKENEAEKHGLKGHQSEREQSSIPDEDFSHVLEFDEGLENVHAALEEMYEASAWGR